MFSYHRRIKLQIYTRNTSRKSPNIWKCQLSLEHAPYSKHTEESVLWRHNPQSQTPLTCYTSSCTLSVRPNRLLCIFKTTGALAFSSLQITQRSSRGHQTPLQTREDPRGPAGHIPSLHSLSLPWAHPLPPRPTPPPSTSTPVLPHSFVPQLSKSAFPRSPGHLDANLMALLRVWKDPWCSSPPHLGQL